MAHAGGGIRGHVPPVVIGCGSIIFSETDFIVRVALTFGLTVATLAQVRDLT
jgi:hypothetical protein